MIVLLSSRLNFDGFFLDKDKMILEVLFHFCERKHQPIFSAFSYAVELEVALPVTGL